MRAGDDRAFEQLYLCYQRRIAAYVYGMVHDHGRAEDITQDVFISALRRMRATDAHIAFKPWIYEIAKNACIDAFRRSKRAEEVSYDVEDGAERLHLMSNGPTPDAAVDTRMSLDHLRGAFGGLSDAHHQILVMRELEGLSYRQIGERLGMSRPSVESTLFRARRRLSEEYEELVSGERCRRIQAIIAGASDGRLGTRDERKMARHVSYCQPCRRAALVAGFDPNALTPKRTVREKIAALLPVPAFLKRYIAGPGADHSGLLSAAAQYAEPAGGGWAKLAACAGALALAGLGAHQVSTSGADKHDAAGTPAAAVATPASARASTPASGGVTAHGAAGAAQRLVASRDSGSKGGVHHTSSVGSSHSTTTTTGAGGSAPGANGGGGSGSSSGSSASAADAKGGSGSKDPVGDAARGVTGAVGGAVGGATGGGGSAPQLPKVQLPTVQVPNLPGAPPVVNKTVDTVNGVVAGTTGAVNGTVGGVTDTVNNTANQTTNTVNQTVGGLGGVVGGATKGAGDTVKGVTGGTGKLLGGG